MSELKFVICIYNTENPASLLLRKIYQVIPDLKATKHGLIRVIDESGEDYLYPSEYFIPLELSQDVATALLQTA
jgi:hypothetical protein